MGRSGNTPGIALANLARGTSERLGLPGERLRYVSVEGLGSSCVPLGSISTFPLTVSCSTYT